MKEQLAAKKPESDKPADADKPADGTDKPKAEEKPAEKKEGAGLPSRLGQQFVEAFLEWQRVSLGRPSRAA